MKFYVYVIQSRVDGRLYKGMTTNLEKRIKQHNNGENKSTKGFLPWVLMTAKGFKPPTPPVLHEAYPSRVAARKREIYFKSGSGREFLKEFLNR